MLRLEDCRLIGRIGKPHGHAGAVKLELLPDLETDLNINEPVFLIIEGKPVPFFMEECNEAANPPILHFEDVKSIDEARKLTGLEVYAPKENVDADTDLVAEQLLGYEAFDQGKSLGKVLAISDSGLQQLLHFEINGIEVLVPLQDELITDINEKKKQLFLDLPEGLLALYFEE